MQDEAGPGYCLRPSLGSVCSSRGWSSWEPHQHVPPGCLGTQQLWHRTRAAPLPPPASQHRRAGAAGLGSGGCGSWWEAVGSRWGAKLPLSSVALQPSACSRPLGWAGAGTGKERGANKAELQRVGLPRTHGCCSVPAERENWPRPQNVWFAQHCGCSEAQGTLPGVPDAKRCKTSAGVQALFKPALRDPPRSCASTGGGACILWGSLCCGPVHTLQQS